MKGRVAREAEAFNSQLGDLPREQFEAFFDFCARELFPDGVVPPCDGSPAPTLTEEEDLTFHRATMDLWRLWQETPRAAQIENLADGYPMKVLDTP